MSDKIINLDNNNFVNYVLTEKIFLVDFWAEWCGPCKRIAPILEEVANEFTNKLIIAKINVDQNPDIALKYNIRSIPTLLLFHNGKVIDSKFGSLSKKELIEFINKNL